MPLGQHFKRHGAVHAFWTISILCLIISALILKLPNGEKVTEIVSFASSVSSLILAVVAILYSMMANEGISGAIGSLKNSSQDIERSAGALEQLSRSLSSQSERILAEFSSLTPAVNQISDKIDRFSPLASASYVGDLENENKTGRAKEKSSEKLSSKKISLGTTACLYIITKSYESKKSFVPKDIFDGDRWQYYLSSFFEAIFVFSPQGIMLQREDSSERDSRKRCYKVTDLGDFTFEKIVVSSEYNEQTKKNMKRIDDYFDSMPTDVQ